MLRNILLIATIMVVVWTSVNASCSKGCTCSLTSSVVECNTINLEPFEMHVFSLKIVHTKEPFVLKNEIFNIKGLENVNTISIENATILGIEEASLEGMPLLSAFHIINCNISAITNSSVFSKASGLRTLKISNSTLRLFENVKSEHLEELVLSGNKLQVISKNTFSDLPYLTYINLSDNIISEIDPLVFSKLSFLQEVLLANNDITSLHSDLFKNNAELVALDFTNNPLRRFNINITADLEKLVLKSCQLQEVNQNVSLNLDYLSYLDLSNNRINFTNTAFNKMIELDYIDLSNNNLTTIDFQIFRKNYKLQKIILDNNNFSILPKFVCSGGNFETYFFSCSYCHLLYLLRDTFKQFPALVTLNLSHNGLTSANLSALHYMRSLIELDLSENAITTLSSDAFSKSTALEKLNLAGNDIQVIDPTIFENNRVLKSLDLSHCLLRSVWSKPVKNALNSLRQLILTSNYITTVNVSDLNVINSIEVLDISNNPLKCDSNLVEIVKWLNEHDVSPVKFKTHDEMNIIDPVTLTGDGERWNWVNLAEPICPDDYYLENFDVKFKFYPAIKLTTKASDDYEYHYGDFDSDEDSSTTDKSDELKRFGEDLVGKKILEIVSSSRNKEHEHYSFLWPTLVFICTTLSVLVIAANIMLFMLRSSKLPRGINVPHVKLPQWNSSTKLKKHSGSVYQPLSEEKYDSCISIAGKKEYVATLNNSQTTIA